MASEPTLLYLIKQVELAVRAELDDAVRRNGLTVLQYTALTVLARRSDLTAAELARGSFVTGQTMADTVTTLQKLGLLGRRPDPVDRRRLILALTPEGRQLLRRMNPATTRVERRMLAMLAQDEQEQLRDMLARCRKGLSARPVN